MSIGIAGIDACQRITTAQASLGIGGGGGGQFPIKNGDKEVAAKTGNDTKDLATSNRLGDRSSVKAYRSGVWFSDYTYAVKGSPTISWREGREGYFGRDNRAIPFMLDSCGFRREITGKAPQWAHSFDNYLAAIDVTDPDGFAAWDYPTDRAKSLEYLRRMEAIFPNDERLWPVFSIRWTWNNSAHQRFARLPVWSGTNLDYLIPHNRTQREYSQNSRELWARQAIANALVIAGDNDFRRMVEKHNKVMLGGMVSGPCPRLARHIFFAALHHVFPDVQFWGLGQANFAVVNGLGQLGLLEKVWVDGSWWLKDSVAERFAFVQDGLITMISLETRGKEKTPGRKRKESFFTLTEMMAANLRSLLAAYQGMWEWPKLSFPKNLPLTPVDPDLIQELKPHFKQAEIDLGLEDDDAQA